MSPATELVGPSQFIHKPAQAPSTDGRDPVPSQHHLGAGRSEGSHQSEQRGVSRSTAHPSVLQQTDEGFWEGRCLQSESQVIIITKVQLRSGNF